MVEKDKYRKHELEKFSSVGVTEESYRILRKEKVKQEKSMMRLVDNLIQEKYGATKHLKIPNKENLIE